MAKRSSYHHGDLKNALLQAALSLLEETGPDSLSLRAVANRVGVSHAAPEHHFPTRKHLLTALATIGFQRFAASMKEERDRAPSDAPEQMRAAMRGYLAYAFGNPALFRLMFTNSLLHWEEPELGLAATDSYRHLAEISAPAAQHMGLTTPEEIQKIEMMVWSHVHGYAHLYIDHKVPGDPDKCGLDLPMIHDLASVLFR